METTLCSTRLRVYIGVILGIMEKKMETTIHSADATVNLS